MKKTALLSVLLIIATVFALVSCASADPWDNAIYTENTTLGEGSITYYLEVIVEEHSVTFTMKTDKTNLGEALRESGIVEGEESSYGLYIKTVNGILADYDKDASFWGITKDGESTFGADTITIDDGAHYELTYSK